MLNGFSFVALFFQVSTNCKMIVRSKIVMSASERQNKFSLLNTENELGFQVQRATSRILYICSSFLSYSKQMAQNHVELRNNIQHNIIVYDATTYQLKISTFIFISQPYVLFLFKCVHNFLFSEAICVAAIICALNRDKSTETL